MDSLSNQKVMDLWLYGVPLHNNGMHLLQLERELGTLHAWGCGWSVKSSDEHAAVASIDFKFLITYPQKFNLHLWFKVCRGGHDMCESLL